MRSFPGLLGAMACLAGGLVTACGEDAPSTPDLGGLVKAPDEAPKPIDIDAAAKSAQELLRAAKLDHGQVGESLGAHFFAGTSRVEVLEGKETVEELEDATRILLESDGDFHALLENSHGYGRDAYYAAGTLYLRPRHGKYHRRPPETPEEPAKIRSEIYGTLGAYFELLAPRAEVSDGGTVKVDGRAARKIELGKAPEPGEAAEESLDQREWRETAVVREVTGFISLDQETGVPLRADVAGAVAFKRDGRTFVMKLAVSHEITSIGDPGEVKPPAKEDTVATPVRATEVEEREELLEGIASPARKPPTPATVETKASGTR